MIARALRTCGAAPGSLIADEVLSCCVRVLEPPCEFVVVLIRDVSVWHFLVQSVQIRTCNSAVLSLLNFICECIIQDFGSKISVQDCTCGH